VSFWGVIQFIISNWGAICALGWGISEVLGILGKGGFIPVFIQAIFQKGAEGELSQEQVVKLNKRESLGPK
jgi:hypothetical protein